jgi:hypothetical protein
MTELAVIKELFPRTRCSWARTAVGSADTHRRNDISDDEPSERSTRAIKLRSGEVLVTTVTNRLRERHNARAQR